MSATSALADQPHVDPHPRARAQTAAFRFLTEEIIAGRLATGEAVDEQALQRQFDESPSSAHEAVARLVQLQLLEVAPDGAARVSRIDFATQAERAEAAAALVAACAARCAATLDAEAAQRIIDILDQLIALNARTDATGEKLWLWQAMAAAFASAAGNRIITSFFHDQLAVHLTRAFRSTEVSEPNPALIEDLLHQLKSAVDARQGAALHDLVLIAYECWSARPLREASRRRRNQRL